MSESYWRLNSQPKRFVLREVGQETADFALSSDRDGTLRLRAIVRTEEFTERGRTETARIVPLGFRTLLHLAKHLQLTTAAAQATKFTLSAHGYKQLLQALTDSQLLVAAKLISAAGTATKPKRKS